MTFNEGSTEGQAPIFQKAVGLVVEMKRLGTRRKVNASQIGTDADVSLIHVSKSILDSKELKGVEQLDGELRRYLGDRCLPSHFKSGIYLLPIALVEEVDAEIRKTSEIRDERVQAFLDVYEDRRADAEERLGSLYQGSDYPDADDVRASFRLESQYVTFDTPASLKSIKADIFTREREKADAKWKDALEECKKLLRATMQELLGHIQERLTPGEDGKTKSFHGSMLDKLDTFMTTFAARNIADDDELTELVKEAKRAMVGIDAKSLRKEEALRDAFKGEVSDLKSKLDKMVIDKPSRVFSGSTEE
jgi:hypothetical protein|tara:strand:- start:3273 stop:4190 length:918 start_codon:yes stop_codon:yes gene_type:complete